MLHLFMIPAFKSLNTLDAPASVCEREGGGLSSADLVYCNTLMEPDFQPLAEGTDGANYQRGPWHISGWKGDVNVNGADIDPFANTDWWSAVSPLY